MVENNVSSFGVSFFVQIIRVTSFTQNYGYHIFAVSSMFGPLAINFNWKMKKEKHVFSVIQTRVKPEI